MITMPLLDQVSESEDGAPLDAAQVELSNGLCALPDGRYHVIARCLGQPEPLSIEKRGGFAALKFRGRWYGIGRAGDFTIRSHPAGHGVATPVDFEGCLRFVGSHLTVDAFESVRDTGECKRWHGDLELPDAGEPVEVGCTQVLLQGTASYSFLNGPTQTSLEVMARVVQQPPGRSVVLPPALTTNRGALTIPVQADGGFSYHDLGGATFKVEGRLSQTALVLVIETAGSLGWTRKELSGEL